MEIKYKNKPSKELIDKYCRKLKEFLSAHNLSMSIELSDTPVLSKESVDGNITNQENWWIARCVLNSPTIKNLEVDLPRGGIDENISDKEIWDDAWNIQEQIYQKLNLVYLLPDNPNWGNDSYWKLWKHLEKLK